MDETMLISVVTPVYNGGRFLQNTYQCLCDQTYKNWEWVVVNDGSSDNTDAVMQALSAADDRIVYLTQRNSGAAKMPRDRAVFESRGSVLLPLDADDRIAPGYLQALLLRMKETGADIVYPRMLFLHMPTGRITQVLPVSGFDTAAVWRGRDLVAETMPDWRIGCNGGLYRREVWVNMSYPGRHEPVWMNSDEIDERLYLLHAERVAFCDAEYTYQNHPESITCRVSPRQFQPLKTCLQLLQLMEQEFGRESAEYAAANRKAFYTWRSLTAHYVSHYGELYDGGAQIMANLRACFQAIGVRRLSAGERLQFLNLCSFQLLFVLFCLKYSPRCLPEILMQRLCPTAYRWLFIRRRTEREIRDSLSPFGGGTGPFVVSLYCGNVKGGGLVDRLRGIVSTYMACKEAGRDFRILFTHPFRLSDYLEPNAYDWRVDEKEVGFIPPQTAVLVCDTQTDTPWERRRQRQKFRSIMEKSRGRQLHVYTNASFCYDADFAGAFRQLFKPSARLEQHLEKIRQELGQPYITVSARFCNLLDDFNEETYNEPLPLAGQETLIASCLSRLEHLHLRHQEQRVVVCSDSTTFLERARKDRDYVYEVPGNVSHIGNDGREGYDYYEKTFLDFFMIAGASHAYLLRGPHMMGSGFPYAAARIGGKECKTITF